jgi:hypothetical protein
MVLGVRLIDLASTTSSISVAIPEGMRGCCFSGFCWAFAALVADFRATACGAKKALKSVLPAVLWPVEKVSPEIGLWKVF